MENRIYIISFGNSTKYRFTPSADDRGLSDIQNDVKTYLANKYPELTSLGFYDQMTVTPVDASNEEQYSGYKEFDAASIGEIKRVLSREVDDMESLRRLNSNAPWGNDADI